VAVALRKPLAPQAVAMTCATKYYQEHPDDRPTGVGKRTAAGWQKLAAWRRSQGGSYKVHRSRLLSGAM